MLVRRVAGFEVPTAVIMKAAILWDVAPFSTYMHQRFGRTCLAIC
jgi:hypothetical protein